jgi:hypothetical protein
MLMSLESSKYVQPCFLVRHLSHSIEKMTMENNGVDSDEAIPEEVLNTFKIPGFP